MNYYLILNINKSNLSPLQHIFTEPFCFIPEKDVEVRCVDTNITWRTSWKVTTSLPHSRDLGTTWPPGITATLL